MAAQPDFPRPGAFPGTSDHRAPAPGRQPFPGRSPGPTRRRFLRDLGVLGGGALILTACTSGGQRSPTAGSGTALPAVEGGTVITDRSKFPATLHEGPDFAALSAAGKLPPVAERVGQDPLVIAPLHGIGRYGGTIRRGFLGAGDFQNAARFCAGPDNLLYWDARSDRVIPNLARDFELSRDAKVLTLSLRRGMRWSDGAPFTADDILFWREDISLNTDLSTGAVGLRAGGQPVRVRKLDTFTVEYVSAVPNPLLPQLMAGWTDIGGMSSNGALAGGGYAPRHYLSRLHPKYTSAAKADRLATDAGFDGWVAYFLNQFSWHKNPQLPTLTPWVVTRPINQPPWEFAANPYSVWVDTDGNQLPYIQTITMSNTESPEVIHLRAIAGEYDFQDRHLAVESLPVLLDNQRRSNYTIHRAPTKEMDFGIRINLAYDADALLGDLLRTVEFRRALSLGIDRDQINEAFFLGTSVPSATMAADDSPYFPGQQWRTRWATHDPQQAGELLDGIGLTERDGAGYRLRPDGGGRIRLDYQAAKAFADFPRIGEMIKEQWQRIGIDLNVVVVEPNLLVQRTIANQLMLSGQQVGTDDPFLRPDTFLPTVTNNYAGMIGIPYAVWFASGGRRGTEPPAAVRQLGEGMRLREQGMQAADAERARIGQELYKLHADQVWSIGVVGFGLSIYGLYYATNRLRNVPGRVLNSLHRKTPSNTLPMTFYYE